MPNMPPAKAKALQEMLNKVIGPKPPLKVDGIFGGLTQAALKELQKKAGVKPTGEVDPETAPVVARAIKTGKVEKDQPAVYLPLGGGKYVGLTDREWDRERKKMIDNLMRGPVREAKMKAAEAKACWEHFNDLNKDQYIISFLVETTRGASLPPKSLIDRAEKAANDIEAVAKAGDFNGYWRQARTCATTVNAAVDAMRKYRNEMIDGSDNWITGLEVTKWASFTFLSIYAAPVVAAELGAGAIASAMIGGAGVKALESAAGEVGNWSAGNAKGQDPGGMISRVLIDAGVGAITGFLARGGGSGKSVVEGITGKINEAIFEKLAVTGLSKKVIETITKYVINEGGKKAFEGAVSDAAKMLKSNQKMTVSEFMTNVATNFLKGVALGNFTKWATKWVDPKKSPFSDEMTKKLRAAVEKDVIKSAGGTIHVEKFLKDSDGMMEKYFTDVAKKYVSKLAEKAIEQAVTKVKSISDTRALDKAVEDEVLTAQVAKSITSEVSEQMLKEFKKSQKK